MENEDDGPWKVTRRDFLSYSAALVAALSLEAAGTRMCQAAQTQFPEGRCEGRKSKEQRALVAYASRYGSTGGVADAVGKELCSRGIAADVRLLRNVGDIASYQAVVIGSPIYRGRWMPEALDFLKRNREVLRQVPVAYFLVCMSLARPTEERRAEVLSYLDPVLEAVPEIKPVAIGRFAGALHYDQLSMLNKRILQSKGTPEGDFRDWGLIRAWARDPVSAKFS